MFHRFMRLMFCFMLLLVFSEVMAANTIISDSSVVQRSYKSVRPQWGLEIIGSSGDMGDRFLTSNAIRNQVHAFSIQTEFQPQFFQALGVIGIGPSLSMYPTSGAKTESNASQLVFAWSVGAQFRYQAVFFRNQPVVPTASYGLELLSYRLRSDKTGRMVSRGPSFGVWVLLNALSPSAGEKFFKDNGVARSYLVLEMKNLTGNDSLISLNGRSYYIGLRLEY